MGKNRSRPHHSQHHHPESNKKKPRPHFLSADANPLLPPSSQSHLIPLHPQPLPKRPTFDSYLETPDLPEKIKLLCQIIANIPSLDVERVLEQSKIRVNQEDVEQVLKLSYGFPGPAVKFFRWSGRQLGDQHSPYSWNLVVDLLGKNFQFEPMWNAIKSMKQENLLSLATFASVFSSYVIANRVKEAIMAFDIMDQYNCPRDTIALNSLLSAICRDGNKLDAFEFLCIAKNTIRPDLDSYAILLEGWESEGNVSWAKKTFSEMVKEIGWDPGNVPAYDSFLSTLLNGPDGFREAMKFFDTMKAHGCYPGLKFFELALEVCVKKGDTLGANLLWKEMIEKVGFRLNIEMYNRMIDFYCRENFTDLAKMLLDEMVFYGAFPDSETYNLLFQFLIRGRKLRDGSILFNEMVKNECVPSHMNCSMAIRVYLDNGESYMAIKVWKCMVENYKSGLEEMGNLLVLRLIEQNMVPEGVKYGEDMIERGIKLDSSTMSKLERSFIEGRKKFVYDELLSKWKSHKRLEIIY